MSPKDRVSGRLSPAIISSLVCLGLFAYLISLYTGRAQEIWEKDERSRLTRILNNQRSNIESELYARIYYTRSVAAYVSLHPELDYEEYYNLANELIDSDPVINSMSLAPDGVIRALYPRSGHEAALGLNLLDHPDRRQIVEKTIDTQKTFVAGPVELMEGGMAFISYTPIFDKTKQANPFWGITDIVIKRDELFAAAGLATTGSGAQFALRGFDGKGHEGEVFFGDPTIFEKNPVSTVIQLPDGEWIIATIPLNGWSRYLNQDNVLLGVLATSAIIISMLIGLFVNAISRLRANARQMKSIFNAMSASIIEIDGEGTVAWVAPTQKRIPPPLNTLKEGDGLEAFGLTNGPDELQSALTATIEKQEFQRCEVQVGTHESNLWAMANLSPKGDSGATVVLYETTTQRQQQDQLVESAEALKEINDDKDLLFSIIAHDLRSPTAAIVSLSESLLATELQLSPEELKSDIELIYRSGKENIFLLENLLNWAQSQKDGLKVQKESVRIDRTIAVVTRTFKEIAIQKNITVHVDIEPIAVHFDPSMLETVFRNLLSNALKFTGTNGNITFSTHLIDEATVEVCIHDDGIGIDSETLEQITNRLPGKSTSGTAKESGTGLGLPLCWNFLERNEASMHIRSTLGQGTEICCTLRRA